MTTRTLETPFVPTFLQAKVTSAYGGSWNLNPEYFAADDTAQWMMARYRAIGWHKQNYEGAGGPFSASEQEAVLVFPGGIEINAGILASYWVREPRWADQDIQAAIQAR